MRISTQLVLFFVFFNAGAGMLGGTGVADDLGINAPTDTPEEFDQAQQTAENAPTGQGTGATLFGLYATLASGFNTLYATILPGMNMLKRTPIPGFIIDFFSTGIVFIGFVNLASFLRSG
jgi:hypothetical protein